MTAPHSTVEVVWFLKLAPDWIYSVTSKAVEQLEVLSKDTVPVPVRAWDSPRQRKRCRRRLPFSSAKQY
jgi:hypothetical protein